MQVAAGPRGRLQAAGARPVASPGSASKPATLLLLLAAGDALFVVLHVAHVATPAFQDPRFSLELDRGFAEVFQYLKEYWIALLLLLLGVAHRAPLFVVWAGLFGYLLADDSFMIHERVGEAVARRLELPPAFPVRPQDVGEAVVSGAVGGLALVALGLAHVRSPGFVRRASWRLLRLVALLAILGLGVDVLHEMVPPGFWYAALAVLEDGGEMVVMTAIVWFVAGLYDTPALPVEERLGRAA